MNDRIIKSQVAPVMAGFFVMGFIDVVGIASNYVKKDFHLNDTISNLMLMMVYLWFFLMSVPVGVMMNKTGRKNMVIVSMAVTIIAMTIPLISYGFYSVLVAFAFIGIGNTIMQVSVNPLLAEIVRGSKLPSALTFGQFIKSVSSFSGPVLAGAAAMYFHNWKLIFVVFALVSLITAIWLYLTHISESKPIESRAGIQHSLLLLNDRFILGLFLGIVLVVGIDVGLNVTIPKYLTHKLNIPLEQAGLGISLYFAAKTAGNFIGALILVKVPVHKFYFITTVIALLALISTILFHSLSGILVGIFATGLAVSNIFAVIYSMAISKIPERKNELSGLMMMGIIGGAIIPLFMGIISDSFGQNPSLMVLGACLLYLLVNSVRIKFVLKSN